MSPKPIGVSPSGLEPRAPTLKTTLLTCTVLMACQTTRLGPRSSPDARPNHQNTWTLTYLKANQGQRDNLKTYLQENWFAMDKLAVSQGLFNDYELIENIDGAQPPEWDFIVAVEYFTRNTYQDVAERFELIRRGHQPTKVNGLGFSELGAITKSETVSKRADIKPAAQCTGDRFELLAPFLGVWEESVLEEGQEQLLGRLAVSVNAEGCSLSKRFLRYGSGSTYFGSGYYDADENAWIETLMFRNGNYSKYKWVAEGDDVVMVRLTGSPRADHLNRNRWTHITDAAFEILEERSYDAGRTWAVFSTTKLRRRQ
jgi:hypothetical protein